MMMMMMIYKVNSFVSGCASLASVPKITQNSYCTLLWRARVARAYNGGLGAEPPARSRGRAPGQGVRAKPP